MVVYKIQNSISAYIKYQLMSQGLTFISISETYKSKTHSLSDQCGTLNHFIYLFYRSYREKTWDMEEEEVRRQNLQYQHLQNGLTYVSTSKTYKPKTYSLSKVYLSSLRKKKKKKKKTQ